MREDFHSAIGEQRHAVLEKDCGPDLVLALGVGVGGKGSSPCDVAVAC